MSPFLRETSGITTKATRNVEVTESDVGGGGTATQAGVPSLGEKKLREGVEQAIKDTRGRLGEWRLLNFDFGVR
jgi:hypothetical protein